MNEIGIWAFFTFYSSEVSPVTRLNRVPLYPLCRAARFYSSTEFDPRETPSAVRRPKNSAESAQSAHLRAGCRVRRITVESCVLQTAEGKGATPPTLTPGNAVRHAGAPPIHTHALRRPPLRSPADAQAGATMASRTNPPISNRVRTLPISIKAAPPTGILPWNRPKVTARSPFGNRPSPNPHPRETRYA